MGWVGDGDGMADGVTDRQTGGQADRRAGRRNRLGGLGRLAVETGRLADRKFGWDYV